MSAYAALVSLLRMLGTNLDGGGLLNIHNRPQLQSLLEKVIFFIHFLDNSSSTHEGEGEASQISALEGKLRETAYRAEDLIESQISAILDVERRRLHVLMISTVFNFFYTFLLLSNRIPVRIPEMVPEWIKIFMLVGFIPALVATAICTICAAGLYLALEAINFLDVNDSRPQETQGLRVVLHDLSSIAKAVIRIKEDVEMSAYAALLSLRKILDPILQESGGQVYHNKSQLEALHGNVTFLLDFLGNASTYMTSKRQKSELHKLEAKISGAVKKAKQLIEFQIPAQIILDSDRKNFRRLMKFMLLALLSSVSALASTRFPLSIQVVVGWVIIVILGFALLALRTSGTEAFAHINTCETRDERQDLCRVIDGLSIIIINVIKIKGTWGNLSTSPPAAAAASSSSRKSVVGLEEDMEKIVLRLIQESSKLEVIPIVGMGGIGKTTLATQVYNHLNIADFFDVRAWVTVAQESSLRHVLLGLLDSAELPEGDEERLGEHLHRYLKNRRYLITMDDVWDTKVWDSVRRFLPDDYNGSRVLLTSRLSNVASYPDSGSLLHHMRCLNENESWRLLREKVFGEEANSCPSELESIGREIAKGCGGLPLAILVIGGLLSKEDRRSIIWEQVARNLKSSQIEEQCLEVLGLSYKHLPHHLRPCFLYMGVFLGDSEIPVSRLINLWAAEGFLKPCEPKSSEEVAEDYLNDLIHRNLIFVCTKSCNGNNRTCGIHDLLRDVCVENARKENFFLVMDGDGDITRERPYDTPRRLTIRPDALRVNASHDSTTSYYNVRSFLCTATASTLLGDQSGLYLGFLYLRVLDVLVLHFGEFPDQIIELRFLRYLAFHYDGPLPPSVSKLHNLETIVHHHCLLENKYPLLPRVIWGMPNLRYLYVKPGCYLSDPFGYPLQWKNSILERLQTLVGIRNFKWSEGVIKRVPNLKKLGISYHVSSSVDWSTYQLESLGDLHQLETLKITIKYNDEESAINYDPPQLVFPQKLKKLILSGCRIPWECFGIGLFPNLEALKLKREACSGPTWETVEEFPKLVFLLLEQIGLTAWETNDEACFPRLQRLVIRSCRKLEEIPAAIGDISTLEMIELDDCHPSAVASARRIQEDQEKQGNVDLKLHTPSVPFI